MNTQTMSAPAINQTPLRIGEVALAVLDLDGTERFYIDVLGLTRIERDATVARLGVGGTVLLTLHHRPGARPRDSVQAGLYHVAFLLPSRADLGAWLAHAARLGVPLDGAADHLVSEAVYLHDPEGNGIEVYVDRPATAWSWTRTPEGPRLAMANERLDAQALIALATRPWSGAPLGTTIGHVHLQVGDVAQALPFYTGVLGMDVTAGRGAAAFLSSGGYHHHLAVNMWNSAKSGARDPDEAGLESVTLFARAARPSATFIDPWGTLFHIRTA